MHVKSRGWLWGVILTFYCVSLVLVIVVLWHPGLKIQIDAPVFCPLSPRMSAAPKDACRPICFFMWDLKIKLGSSASSFTHWAISQLHIVLCITQLCARAHTRMSVFLRNTREDIFCHKKTVTYQCHAFYLTQSSSLMKTSPLYFSLIWKCLNSFIQENNSSPLMLLCVT